MLHRKPQLPERRDWAAVVEDMRPPTGIGPAAPWHGAPPEGSPEELIAAAEEKRASENVWASYKYDADDLAYARERVTPAFENLLRHLRYGGDLQAAATRYMEACSAVDKIAANQQ
jgi:hypothetical protein